MTTAIDWQFSRPAQLIFPSGASRPIGNIRTHRVRVEMIFGGLPCRRSLTPRASPSRVPVLSFAHYFQAMWKRNPESRERLGSGIQVPLTKTAIQYLESRIPCLESRIHDCLGFVYSGWKIFVSVVGLSSIWSWAIKNCRGYINKIIYHSHVKIFKNKNQR